MTNTKIYITLHAPKFDQPEKIKLGFNYKYLFLGPVAAITEREYFAAFVIIILSFFSFGLFWVYYAYKVNRFKIISKLKSGYKVRSKEDEEVIRRAIKMKDFEIDEVKLSRLGSLDGNIKYHL